MIYSYFIYLSTINVHIDLDLHKLLFIIFGVKLEYITYNNCLGCTTTKPKSLFYSRKITFDATIDLLSAGSSSLCTNH